MELPAEFTKEMRELLGGEYSAWMESMEKGEAETGSFRGLRVNTLKAEPEELRKRLPFSLRPIPWTGNGFYIEGGERASRHPYYAAGLYYLQEPSAMVPAAALPIEEGDRVLDLCAAPGGKATELAARLCGTGLLAANDISNSRAKALLKNLELFGAENILVTSESPERLCSYFEGFFDKILIDAPCSGEGMFRKEPSMVKDWKEKGPLFYAGLQKEIVSQAARLLRPGGLLLFRSGKMRRPFYLFCVQNRDSVCCLWRWRKRRRRTALRPGGRIWYLRKRLRRASLRKNRNSSVSRPGCIPTESGERAISRLCFRKKGKESQRLCPLKREQELLRKTERKKGRTGKAGNSAAQDRNRKKRRSFRRAGRSFPGFCAAR